jgi:hypothetical protein
MACEDGCCIEVKGSMQQQTLDGTGLTGSSQLLLLEVSTAMTKKKGFTHALIDLVRRRRRDVAEHSFLLARFGAAQD